MRKEVDMLDVSIKLEFLGLSNIKDYKEYELEIMMLYEIVEKCIVHKKAKNLKIYFK